MVYNWSQDTTYYSNDIVQFGNDFYYSKKTNLKTQPKSIDISVYYFNLNINNISQIENLSWSNNYFFWTPTYNSKSSKAATINEKIFGDGYLERSVDGYQSVMFEYDAIFENISEKEAYAISHFLENKGGDVFLFKAPFPYDRYFVVRCENFSVRSNFKNSYSISAKFVEGVLKNLPDFGINEITESSSSCDYTNLDTLNLNNFTTSDLGYYDDSYFGKDFLLLKAKRPNSSKIEEFVVKCQVLNPSENFSIDDYMNGQASITSTKEEVVTTEVQRDCVDLNSEEAKELSNTTTELIATVETTEDNNYIIKPFNYSGYILGLIKLAKSSGSKPTDNSYAREYSLDGNTVEIFIEKHGELGELDGYFKENISFVTPQYFPFELKEDRSEWFVKSNENKEISNYPVNDVTLGKLGPKFYLKDALLLFWKAYKYFISFNGTIGHQEALFSPELAYETKTSDKTDIFLIDRFEDFDSIANYPELILNNYNRSTSAEEQVTSILGKDPDGQYPIKVEHKFCEDPVGYTFNNGTKERCTLYKLKTWHEKAQVANKNDINLHSLIMIPIELRFYSGKKFMNITPSVSRDPIGTNPDFYGTSIPKCGYLKVFNTLQYNLIPEPLDSPSSILSQTPNTQQLTDKANPQGNFLNHVPVYQSSLRSATMYQDCQFQLYPTFMQQEHLPWVCLDNYYKYYDSTQQNLLQVD